jgi:F-type H+-transporting ATPase subunit gamma
MEEYFTAVSYAQPSRHPAAHQVDWEHLADFAHPLMEERQVRKRAVILVGTDKGLCGSLNANLFRVASQFDPATTVYIAVGKRAAQFVARSRRQLAAEFTCPDSPRFADARPIANFARDLFLKREVDEVRIVATRFINTTSQQAVAIESLPIGEIKTMTIPGADSEVELAAHLDAIVFEPNAHTVLSFLFGHYLNIFVYRVLLEAKASEQSARMVAMTNATDSATDLIKHLTLEYNKLRQGNITKELLEIAGGQLGND